MVCFLTFFLEFLYFLHNFYSCKLLLINAVLNHLVKLFYFLNKLQLGLFITL